jgi:translation initiation factor 2B subunit (eIF-2B alpha/beta/delta family)
LEAKYEAQVRRTEEIQIHSQEKILELQRMTTIGQSKQLAEFLLEAKEWLIPGSKPAESRGIIEPPIT